MTSQPTNPELDEIALHIANSKAHKFYIETGKCLRDSIKVEYQRTARTKLDSLIKKEALKAQIAELNHWLDEASKRKLIDAEPSIRFIDFRDRKLALTAQLEQIGGDK